MAWGGGGGFGRGGGFGGSSHQQSSGAGLPFAGIPSELADRIDELVAEEPEHPEPRVTFTARNTDTRPLTLRNFLAPFKWPLLGALLLVVIETVAMRIGPTITQIAIDRGMGLEDLGQGPVEGSKPLIVAMAGVYLLSVFVAVGVGYARTSWSGRVGERLLYTLRVRVFSHLQRLSLDFFTKKKAGVLMTRMTSDIEHLRALFHEGMVQLVVQALTLLVLGAQLIYFSPRLGAITLLAVTPVMVVLTLWFQKASTRGYLDVRDRIADLLADLSESLAGIRLVTAHNRQRHNTISHANLVGAHKDANDYTARVAGIYGPSGQALGHVAVVIVLLIGGNMVLRGEMQVGELTGFMLAVTAFFAPVQQLAQLYNSYQQGQAAIVKLRQLLATEPSVQEAPDALDLPQIEGHITLDDVSFGYEPATPVLEHISLDIQPGETYALVGATGAGKSTIAKLVTRFYDPTQGRVQIDGHDLRDVRLDSLRRQLGVVPQEPFLFAGTIRDNVSFARPDAPTEEVEEAARVVGLGELIDRLPQGLDTPVHERGSSLSAGERQLLALARAFLARPRVIVLDEATSSLDLKSERLVESALDAVLEGRTAIIIAHRLATALRADKIAVIDDGRLVELGSHDELVQAGGLYADMYATWESHTTPQQAFT